MTTTTDPAARLAAHDSRFRVPCEWYKHTHILTSRDLKKGPPFPDEVIPDPKCPYCAEYGGLGYLPLSGPALLAACLEACKERGYSDFKVDWAFSYRDSMGFEHVGVEWHLRDQDGRWYADEGPTPEAAVAAALCKAWGLDK